MAPREWPKTTAASRRRRSQRAAVVALLALPAVTGCAVPRNTAAQDRALEAWSRCRDRFPTTLLKEVRADGQIAFLYRSPSDAVGMLACLQVPAVAVPTR